LIALLTELGFKSKMVLLSTQKHGYVYEEYPSPDLFDYIICEVTVGEKTMLLDATAPVIEANLLPERCLNGKGLVVDDKTFHWTNLLADQKYVVSVKHEVTLTSATEVSGKSRYEYAQLAKPQTRKKFLSDKETYIQSEEQSKPGLDITELTIDSVDTHCNKLVENVSFKINDVVKSYDDKIILPLTLCWGTLKNPLNSEERDYPVEMSFPYKSYDMIEIKIPDGYTVEQLPKSSAIQTADGGCKYSLTVIAENGLIKVVSAFNANKIFYEPQEFSMLHDFFDKMVEKDEEKVILKKI